MDWGWLYSSFDGRINRAKFWAGTIALWILSLLVNLVIAAVFGMRYDPAQAFPVMGPAAWLVWILAALGIAYASLAVLAKRWHDRDKSGWWSLIGLVPFIGGVWILVECGCLPGTEGPNRFGPDPLAG
ncbi:MAG TPA: DUF805 domain-containing protein [Aestuariivirgaceae bacterium]|jgi:uncharacterized membrane protein YhaH (DUF805 family)|nr:DUF805 domain-containing protein [Aestuariivirgaceae bacterium]